MDGADQHKTSRNRHLNFSDKWKNLQTLPGLNIANRSAIICKVIPTGKETLDFFLRIKLFFQRISPQYSMVQFTKFEIITLGVL